MNLSFYGTEKERILFSFI